MAQSLNQKALQATKWSAVTEVAVRLLMPIVNMVLARLLTPEAFGVVTTLTMIITFAEIFTDAGFQKYLIQHEFTSDRDRDESTCVAFWSNLFTSIIIWVVIAIFSEQLATLVGNPGLGIVLVIACASIPLEAFSSIQMALYKRDLDFKTLFKVRMVSVIIPLVVTIPLAFWLRTYWALVIGTLTRDMVNALLLTWYSKWKPRLFYSLKKLKEMFSFTMWSMIEQVSIWLTSYVDIFIVGTMLSQYYLGLYKTSSTLVGQILGLITATTTPILFSALSRLQSDEAEFQQIFFRFQKLVGLLVIPMSVGVFCFSNLVTSVVLGNQWMEASGFIGLWALTSSVTIIFWHFSSEVYRAKGRPKLSVLAQVLHIIFLWPTVLFSVKYGFEVLYISRSLVRLQGVLVHMVLMYMYVHISPWKMTANVLPSILASVVMMITGLWLVSLSNSLLWQLCAIIVCAAIYGCIVLLFPEERSLLYNFILKRNTHEGISSR